MFWNKKKKKKDLEKKSFKVQTRFEKRKKEKFNLNKTLTRFLEIAGIEMRPREYNKKIIVVDLVIFGIVLLTTLIAGIILKTPAGRLILMLFLIAVLVSIAIYLLSILAVFLYLDLRIYKRTRQLEEVLPDFLQLTSANISAGMTIDRALWLAVRPRFGVLAHEIEEIAKATIAGEDLSDALVAFSQKYDSQILKESMNLLLAGLESGGEVAVLLNKIAVNIQETKLMQKEIAANVMTYVIFISVATILAAPFLFALSAQLLLTTTAITDNLEFDTSAGSTSSFAFNFQGGIEIENFTNFSLIMLVISSIFSVAIISTIRKGNVKNGFKLMPIFIAVSFLVYYLSRILFKAVLGGLF